MDDDEAYTAEKVTELQEWIRRQAGLNGRGDASATEFIRYTGRQYRSLPKPKREELLGPLVVRGERLVIGAGTGAGKTTLVWQIAKALCTGGHFLGWQASRPYRVLVIDCEQTPWDIDRLLDETGLAQSDQIEIISLPEGMALAPGSPDCVRLEQDIAAGWDVIALDPLYKLHDGDQNDEQQAKALMKILDGWRAKYNFNLILPAHMRKRQGRSRDQEFTLDEIAGSASYLRGAEVVIGLRLVTDGLSHLHFFKARGPGLPVRTYWPLKFDRNAGFMIAETSADRAKREHGMLLQKVRDLLLASGGAGLDLVAIMEGTGKKRSTVQGFLEEIGAEYHIAPGRAKKKLWFLPDVQPDQQDLEILEEDDLDDE